jgi:hypothetical protein
MTPSLVWDAGDCLQIHKFTANILSLQSLIPESGGAAACKITSRFYSPRFAVLTAMIVNTEILRYVAALSVASYIRFEGS